MKPRLIIENLERLSTIPLNSTDNSEPLQVFKQIEANIVVALRLRPFLPKEIQDVRSTVTQNNQVILRNPHDVL